jgi:hypothetical protein
MIIVRSFDHLIKKKAVILPLNEVKGQDLFFSFFAASIPE